MYFTNKLTDGNSQLKQTLVDNLWYIGDSINNKFIDRLQMDKARQKYLPTSFC